LLIAVFGAAPAVSPGGGAGAPDEHVVTEPVPPVEECAVGLLFGELRQSVVEIAHKAMVKFSCLGRRRSEFVALADQKGVALFPVSVFVIDHFLGWRLVLVGKRLRCRASRSSAVNPDPNENAAGSAPTASYAEE
jgi:hypothetical protein